MNFIVCDAKGGIKYEGISWPMARAALDFLIAKTPEDAFIGGLPSLRIEPDPDTVIKAGFFDMGLL